MNGRYVHYQRSPTHKKETHTSDIYEKIQEKNPKKSNSEKGCNSGLQNILAQDFIEELQRRSTISNPENRNVLFATKAEAVRSYHTFRKKFQKELRHTPKEQTEKSILYVIN